MTTAMEFVFGVCVLSTVLFAGMAARAQATQTPTQTPDQHTPPPAASPAKKFPFPGEQDAPSAPGTVPVPQNPAASPATQTPPDGRSTGQKFPFPGAPEAPAAHEAPADSAADSASSSSTSSSSSDADQPPLHDAGSSGDVDEGPHGKRRAVPRPVHVQTPEEREAEDLDVAGFYMDQGNFKGAYARAQDAVTLNADDAFAQMALAAAARKMNKPDEARSAYAAVLKLDATPKQKKDAQAGLAELNGKAAPHK